MIDWKKGDGLIPAIVQDAKTSRVLMLAYMNEESLQRTRESGLVTFFSRSRQALWTKGETSGNSLRFISISEDCDGDTLLVRAEPKGPVCHTGTETCFRQNDSGFEFLGTLQKIVEERFANPDPKSSYTAKLILEGLDRIVQKVGEEAVETVIAAKNDNLPELEGEAADLLFHLMVLLKAKGSSLNQVVDVLIQRHSNIKNSN